MNTEEDKEPGKSKEALEKHTECTCAIRNEYNKKKYPCFPKSLSKDEQKELARLSLTGWNNHCWLCVTFHFTDPHYSMGYDKEALAWVIQKIKDHPEAATIAEYLL